MTDASPHLITEDNLPITMTRKEVAFHLQISERTVSDWVEAGILPRPSVLGGKLHRFYRPGIMEAIRPK